MSQPFDSTAAGGRERRMAPRLGSANLVSYCSLKGAKVYSILGVAETLDLSTGGMRILTRESLLLGTVLQFDLKLGDHLHTIKGELVRGWVREGGSFEFGVAFVDLSADAGNAIRHYLSWVGHFKGIPKRGAMTGGFDGEQLSELVQMLGMSGKTGVLRVYGDSTLGGPAIQGMLVLREGRLVSASSSRGSPGTLDAACDLLLASHGSFEFRPDLPVGLVPDGSVPVETLLLEALKRRDELATPAPGGEGGTGRAEGGPDATYEAGLPVDQP